MEEEVIYYYRGGKVQDKTITRAVVVDGVEEIDEGAFEGCEKLQIITIADCITSIRRGAFEGCQLLESIMIPDSVISIGSSAFFNCSSLQTVVISDTLTTIGNRAFALCGSLESIITPEGLKTIEEAALGESWRSVQLPESLTEIGEGAFQDCSALQHFDIPNGITRIATYTFSGCFSLEDVTLPNYLSEIDDCAFEGCEMLQRITIPKGVKAIANQTFDCCSSLHTVELPATLKEIRFNAFGDCPSLKIFVIPNGLPELQGFDPIQAGFDPSVWNAAKPIMANATGMENISLVDINVNDEHFHTLLELIFLCPNLRRLDITGKEFTSAVFEMLLSQGIPDPLRTLQIKNESWQKGSTTKHLLRLLDTNPRLTIHTSVFWDEGEEGRIVRHHLDMNEYGCHGFTVRDSRWPVLIESLVQLEKEEQLQTGAANILYQLLYRHLDRLISRR